MGGRTRNRSTFVTLCAYILLQAEWGREGRSNIQGKTISEKGQIVIPASLCRQFGLKKGDRLAIEAVDGAILLRPVPCRPLLAMGGSLKKAGEEKLTAILHRKRSTSKKLKPRARKSGSSRTCS